LQKINNCGRGFSLYQIQSLKDETTSKETKEFANKRVWQPSKNLK
jgi:hypothetical protein